MKRRWMIAALGVAVGFCFAAHPAAAHSDTGTIEVVSVTAPAPLSLRVDANITYVDDGHPASTATATVVAERAGAPTVGPVVLTASSTAGRYGATITVPSAGDWTLRLSSLSPTASTERRETVTVPATTTSTPPTSTPPTTVAASSPTSTVVSGGVAPLTSTAAPTTSVDATDPPGDRREPGKDRFATTIAFIGILAAVAIVAGLAMRSARRGRQASGSA